MKGKKKAILGSILVFVCAMLMALPISAANVEISKREVTTAVGRSFTLTVENNSSGENVIWSSSKPSIATVDSQGVVTAKKKGTTTIKAKVGGTTLKCKVTVDNNAWKNKKNLRYASSWSDISYCDSEKNTLRAQIQRVKYNSYGTLVAYIAIENETSKKYELSEMSVVVRKNDSKGTILAKATCSVDTTIDPNTVATIQIKFNKNTTRRVVNLNNLSNVYCRVTTN